MLLKHQSWVSASVWPTDTDPVPLSTDWGTFEFFTNYTKMPIVAFSSLLCENKKNLVIKCCTLSGNRTWALRFQLQHTPPYPNCALATWEICKFLFMHHDFWTLIVQLESIEHDYIRYLKS